MSAILSKLPAVLDGSSGDFRRAAGDIGEAIALLRGAAKQDPATVERICRSLHGIRGFLTLEAAAQAYREQIASDQVITEVVTQIVRSPRVAMPEMEAPHAHP